MVSPVLSDFTQKIAPDQLTDMKRAVKQKVIQDGSGALTVSALVNAIKGIAGLVSAGHRFSWQSCEG